MTNDALLPQEVLDAAQSAFKGCFSQFADINQTRLSDGCLTAIIEAADAARAHPQADAPALEALREAVTLFEADDECNQPGTDAHAWLIRAREIVATPVSPAPAEKEVPTDDKLRHIIYENFDSEEATFAKLRELFSASPSQPAEARVSVPEGINDLLTDIRDKLLYAYGHVASVTADKVNGDIMAEGWHKLKADDTAHFFGSGRLSACRHWSIGYDCPVGVSVTEKDKCVACLRALSAAPSSPVPRLIAGETEALKAHIQDDAIIIRLPIDNLPVGVDGAWAAGYLSPRLQVTDAAAFAKDLCHALNDEAEDGTTQIHRLFDKAVLAAFEAGAQGIEKATRLCKSEDRPAQEQGGEHA